MKARVPAMESITRTALLNDSFCRLLKTIRHRIPRRHTRRKRVAKIVILRYVLSCSYSLNIVLLKINNRLIKELYSCSMHSRVLHAQQSAPRTAECFMHSRVPHAQQSDEMHFPARVM